jgi:hypothetical protein
MTLWGETASVRSPKEQTSSESLRQTGHMTDAPLESATGLPKGIPLEAWANKAINFQV